MSSPINHTRVKRIHEDLDECINIKKGDLKVTLGISRVNYYDASKKLAEDYKRYQQEIAIAKKEFPLYKRFKNL